MDRSGIPSQDAFRAEGLPPLFFLANAIWYCELCCEAHSALDAISDACIESARATNPQTHVVYRYYTLEEKAAIQSVTRRMLQ